MEKKNLVLNKLRDLIINGYFRPGEYLKEREIAEKLGVSRTPVRDAFNRLELEGLIMEKGRKGMMIPFFTETEVKDLYDVREYIEGLAVKLVTEKGNKKVIYELENMIKQAKEAALNNDIKEQTLINGTFHQLIAESTENLYIINIFHSLQSSINLMRSTSLSVDGRLTTNIEEHVEIVEAMKVGNAFLAENVTRKHISNSLAHVLSSLKANENKFDIYS